MSFTFDDRRATLSHHGLSEGSGENQRDYDRRQEEIAEARECKVDQEYYPASAGEALLLEFLVECFCRDCSDGVLCSYHAAQAAMRGEE